LHQIKTSNKITLQTLIDFAHPMNNVVSSFQQRLQRQTSVRTLTNTSNENASYNKCTLFHFFSHHCTYTWNCCLRCLNISLSTESLQFCS